MMPIKGRSISVPRISVKTDEQVSQEFQLLSKDEGRLTWQTGLFYFSSRSAYDPLLSFSTVPHSPPSEVVFEALERLKSYAGFGQATYRLGDATNLTVGLRYTKDERTHDNSSVFSNAFVTVPEVGAASKDFSKPTWRFDLDHHFTQDVLGYFSYNRGFKSGTFDPQAFPAKVLVPETLDAFELGIKSEFLDQRIRLNAAAYYYDYKNIQVTQFTDRVEIVYSGSGATSYGLDLDLVANVTSELSVNAGVGWIHARYGNFPDAFKTTPNPACYGMGCGGNTLTLSENATGHHLQDTPDATFNVGAAYHIPVSFGGLVLAGNYYYNSGYFSEPENRLYQGSYGVIDASLAWTSMDSRYDVRLWGKNLADKVYASQLATLDQGDTRVAAPGRTVGITGAVRF